MIIEQRIVAFALGHPGLGPRRIAAQLARPEWGGLKVSANGVWKVLGRHGLNTRAKRLGLVAGYRAPYEPPVDELPEPHIDTDRPGELVGIDCFFVGRLHGTAGAVWQLTAIDTYSSFAWTELVRCPHRPGLPAADLPLRAAHRHRATPRRLAPAAAALRQRQRIQRTALRRTDRRAGRPPQPHQIRAPTNQRPCRTTAPHHPGRVLASRLRALPAGPLPRPATPTQRLHPLLQPPPRPHRTQDGRAMPGRPRLRCPQDGAQMSRTCRHNSESVQPRARPSRPCRGRPTWPRPASTRPL
jgi:hypothetical protein